jgi:hypothetical protein
MLELAPVNIICHSRRDQSSYLSIIEILNMYDLDGLNYKIWTTYRGTFYNLSKNIILYTEADFQLTTGNLFRLDILVFEMPTTIHPFYLQKHLTSIRESFPGTIIFIGENIDSDFNYLLDKLNYPIYYIKKTERKFSGFKTLTELRDEVREDSHTIEDKLGNIQTISSWKKAFIRDRKLGNILGK